MGDIEVKLNKSGFRTHMKSAEIGSLLLQSARQMESAAERANGGNYLSNLQEGRVSAHAMAATGDRKAAAKDHKYNTLRKCIDAGVIS